MLRNLNRNPKESPAVSIKEFLDTKKTARETVPLYQLVVQRCAWIRCDSTCVVSGTEVLMAHRGFKNVEDIQSGDVVLNAYHEPVVVLANVVGIEEIPTVSLKFENGTALRCTELHPFLMPVEGKARAHVLSVAQNGPGASRSRTASSVLTTVRPEVAAPRQGSRTSYFLQANELQLGMTVSTIGGTTKVSEIGLGPRNEEVYHIVLVSQAMWQTVTELPLLRDKEGILQAQLTMRRLDPFLGLHASEHTYFANGIAVGDVVIESGLQN